jgi:hypothetical protein
LEKVQAIKMPWKSRNLRKTGIFCHIIHSAVCPDTGTRKRVAFFHVTKPGEAIKKPPEGHIFNEDVQDHGAIGIRKQK